VDIVSALRASPVAPAAGLERVDVLGEPGRDLDHLVDVVEVRCRPGLGDPAPPRPAEERADHRLGAEGRSPGGLGGAEEGDGRVVPGGGRVLGVEADLQEDPVVGADVLGLVVLALGVARP
jgi:hypothetical protein